MCTMLTNLRFTSDINKVIIKNIILEDDIEIKQNLTDHYTKFEPCFYRNYGKEMVLHTEILY